VDRPSVTAQRVAARRLHFERQPAAFGDPDADQRLQADVAAGITIGGETPMARYLAVRTAFFDRVVVTALERGTTQVVVAAAGYDGRALRYRRPGVTWYEVDLPSTQADKRARLERLGLDTAGLVFVAADFNLGGVAGALAGAGLDAGRPALITCEGVAVYLDVEVLEMLLSGLRAACCAGSRLAISLSVESGGWADDRRRAAFRALVAAIGEPARGHLTSDQAGALLARTGWSYPQPDGDERTGRARRAGLVVAEAV
jgi:methyltransferase (TIGR00027 family)